MTRLSREIFVVGTSTSVAPASVRERLHVDLEDIYAGLERVRAKEILLEEALPLTTCGRLEVYGVSTHPSRAARALLHLARGRTGVASSEIEAHSYLRRGEEAARHLFRVAAGLDSVIYGEAQILGQVQKALDHPSTKTVAGSLLTRLFQAALATGKRVRSETEIGRGSASVAGAALGLLEAEMGSLSTRTAVVLGSGETGSLIARLMRKEGVGRLLISNRTLGRARSLADELDGEAHGMDELPELLRAADVVVGAVAEREDVVTARLLEPIVRADPRPRFFLDLAHPRNFARDLSGLPGVRVLDLAQVFERVEAARKARAAQVPLAETILEEEVESFAEWRRSRDTATVLRAVREQVMALARDEANRKSRGLSEADRADLHRFAQSLARRMLHSPTVAIRRADPTSTDGQWLLRNATSLFGVSEKDATGDAG